MGALALRLLGSAAGALGLNSAPVAFAAGLVVAVLPVAWVTGKFAYAHGYLDGVAAADRQAEVNTLTRERNEARADAAIAAAARDLARAGEAHNAEATIAAANKRDEYARELAKRGPAGACALTDADLARLQVNAWGRAPAGRRADPPARR